MSSEAAARDEMLLRTGDLHDFVIVCGGKEFRVHIPIICPRSDVLRKLCTGPFKERHDRRAGLEFADADTFERVLWYLYTGDFDDVHTKLDKDDKDNDHKSITPIPDAALSTNRLLTNVKVYVLADFLNLSGLRDLASRKFESSIITPEFPPCGFNDVIREAFENTHAGDIGLRLTIFNIHLRNLEKLEDDKTLSEILMEHEPMACRVAQSATKTLQASQAQCEALRKSVQAAQQESNALKKQLSNSKLLLEEAWASQQSTEAKYQYVIGLLDRIGDCRHCHRSCSWAFNTKRQPAELRCTSCGTNHVY